MIAHADRPVKGGNVEAGRPCGTELPVRRIPEIFSLDSVDGFLQQAPQSIISIEDQSN
jgi:hypothetical protein